MERELELEIAEPSILEVLLHRSGKLIRLTNYNQTAWGICSISSNLKVE